MASRAGRAGAEQVVARIAREDAREQRVRVRVVGHEPRQRMRAPQRAGRRRCPSRSRQLARMRPSAGQRRRRARRSAGGGGPSSTRPRAMPGWRAANSSTTRAPCDMPTSSGLTTPSASSSAAQILDVGGERRLPGRQAEAAPVVTDDAHRGGQRRLRLPHLEVERPAVHEDHGAARAVVAIAQTGAGHLRARGARMFMRFSDIEKDFAIRLRARRGSVKRAARGRGSDLGAEREAGNARQLDGDLAAGLAQHGEALAHQRGLGSRGANGWSC